MKDNFSSHAADYAIYRPGYPDRLFQYIEELVERRECCWDCGCGNGQTTSRLADIFHQVHATDISQNQIRQAPEFGNVLYSVQPAERVNFPDDQFDLIMVAQAIHWFDFDQFYKEVRRTGKPGSYLVVVGYGLHKVDPGIDPLIDEFYHDVVGPFWDPERVYLESKYQTIPFPFDEIPSPDFQIQYQWNASQQIGYLNTWSAVKHYVKANGDQKILDFFERIKTAWGDGTRTVTFPTLLRVGKIQKKPAG